MGFFDKQIVYVVNSIEDEVCVCRLEFGICFWVKKIDIFVVEFFVDINYLYIIYNVLIYDINFEDKGIVIFGSGVYCIGSFVEFDWCVVSVICVLKVMDEKMVMINVSVLFFFNIFIRFFLSGY